MTITTQYDLELPGCTPEPLMAYLKALGVLRLVSEQKDPGARGWWKDEMFWLRSTLDRDALVKFFLEDYKPTPIFSPWNGDGGFLSDSGTSVDTVQKFRITTEPRFKRIKDAIETVDNIPLMEEFRRNRDRAKELGKKKKAKIITDSEVEELKVVNTRVKEIKQTVVKSVRSGFPDTSLHWLDSCMILEQDGFTPSPLLGSGGIDGHLDFGTNFLKNIQSLMTDANSKEWLLQALFNKEAKMVESSIGQFSPGQIGGPNATQGFEGDSLINLWDFVLMMEGALLLAGAAVRRFGSTGRARVSFPFVVRAIAAGFSSPAQKDAVESRGEMWLPLWNRPTGTAELRHIFGEGRAEVSGRPVRNGTDFARAVAELGVDRGITGFNRLAFLKRSGKAFLAVPLGRFEVRERREADLLREIDAWLNSFRSACSVKKPEPPPRVVSTLRDIDSSIFEFCKYGGKPLFQKILIAFGRAERELALTEGKIGKWKVNPLTGLSSEWIDASSDGSLEFIIGRALASMHDPEGKIGPLRANLEPVDWKKRCRAWAEKDRAVVWNATDLPMNMSDVLQRRMMDGERAGCERLPIASRFSVPLDAIAAFIAGDLDYRRIEDLLWGLMLVKDSGKEIHDIHETDALPLPRAYALLKLLFLPRPVVMERTEEGTISAHLLREGESGGVVIRPEPAILPLLKAGRLGEACRIAMRRLRASGLVPMPSPIRGIRVRDEDWQELDCMGLTVIDPRRLAAALLIPINNNAVNRIFRLVIGGGETGYEQAETSAATNQEGGMI